MGQYDALFEAEPQVQSKYDALFEEEPTPTPAPATIRSEGQAPEPRETFVEKMKALFAPTPEAVAYGQQQFTASPEELEALPAQMAAQQAAHEQVIREHREPLPVIPGEENLVEPPFLTGVGEAVREAIPQNVGAAVGMLAEGMAPAWTAGREVLDTGRKLREMMQGKPREEAFPPEKPFTEYTPEDWGRFTGRVGLQTAMAIPVFKGLRPHIGPPTGIKVPEEVRPALPEAIARQREAQLRAAVEKPTLPEPIGPGTAADAITKAVDELRFQEAAPAINRQLAREEPTAPSVAEATEAAPKVREAISLDELRLMRERGELEAQPKDATGRSHPAVEERIAQIDEELTHIANRELQEATAGGEQNASEVTSPTRVSSEQVRPEVDERASFQQPRETTPVLKLEEEAVPRSGATPKAEAAVAPLAGEPLIPEGERGYAGLEPPPTEPVAPAPAPGVPQKPSKIGQSIEAKAVEAKLAQGFAETAGYDPITIAHQSQLASDVIRASPMQARAMIRGEAPLPEGLRGTSLITAMEEHLLDHPNAQVAYEMANSPLTSATSAAAQEMRLMSERVPDSITAKFAEIRAARAEGAKLRGETAEKIAKDINKEVVKSASKRPTWEAFVREIVC